MGWKTLNDEIKKNICSRCAYSSMELLEELINEYNFFYYTRFDDYFPILDMLGSYKFKLQYVMEDCCSKDKAYLQGQLQSQGFDIDREVFDHAILMKTLFNDVYIISNPYLNDDSLRDILSAYVGTCRYSILGKERSYYNPNKTNIFLLKIS